MNTIEVAPKDWRPDRLERLEQLARKIDPVRVAVVCAETGKAGGLIKGAVKTNALMRAIISEKAMQTTRRADTVAQRVASAPLVCLVAAAKQAGDIANV